MQHSNNTMFLPRKQLPEYTFTAARLAGRLWRNSGTFRLAGWHFGDAKVLLPKSDEAEARPWHWPRERPAIAGASAMIGVPLRRMAGGFAAGDARLCPEAANAGDNDSDATTGDCHDGDGGRDRD